MAKGDAQGTMGGNMATALGSGMQATGDSMNGQPSQVGGDEMGDTIKSLMDNLWLKKKQQEPPPPVDVANTPPPNAPPMMDGGMSAYRMGQNG